MGSGKNPYKKQIPLITRIHSDITPNHIRILLKPERKNRIILLHKMKQTDGGILLELTIVVISMTGILFRKNPKIGLSGSMYCMPFYSF